MLLKDDKKKVATMLVAKLKKDGSDSMEEAPKNEMGDTMDSEMGLDSATEEVLMAIEKKDPAMLKAALRSFMEMCEYDKE